MTPDTRRAVTGSGDGTVQIWDVATGDELARLISIDSGEDWLITTPEGLFDRSAGGRRKVSYRVDNGLIVVPVDRFFQDFYYPGLLSAIFRGERPVPMTDFTETLPVHPCSSSASPTLSFYSNHEFDHIIVHRHDFDVITRRAGIQGMFDLFEWISISCQ